MNQLELLHYWLIFAFEIALFAFVFARRARRLLPYFATYSIVILDVHGWPWTRLHAFRISILSFLLHLLDL